MKINILGIMNPMFNTEEKDIPSLINNAYKLSDNDTDPSEVPQSNTRLQDHIRQYCGTIGGECYSTEGMPALTSQPKEKAFTRADNCANGGHLSVFGHFVATLELVGISKAMCMLLNNNHINNTSERSMRYTNMKNACSEKDIGLYDKWKEIFYNKIQNTYGVKYPEVFTKSLITKKANENARYIISSYYKTRMVYTNDVREFTYISKTIDKTLSLGDDMPPFLKGMKDELIEFNNLLKGTGLVFDCFNDQREKRFSLLSKNNRVITPYYGDCIADTYKMSLSCTAQLQRHRFLNISIAFDDEPEYFVPEILRDDKKLVEDWLNDCRAQKDVFPQATLINVNEIAPAYLIIKKDYERLCSGVQQELCINSLEQAKRIAKNMIDPELKQQFARITGSKCLWQENFKCPTPCGFIEGVKCTRKV